MMDLATTIKPWVTIMRSENIYQLINIDNFASTPKYMQIVNSIIFGVETQKINNNVNLPSINDLSHELDVARATAEKAYRHLKMRGVINSIPGKGFYIENIDSNEKNKIFLLFDNLGPDKKTIYDSFTKTIGDSACVDLFIYHNDFETFKRLLNKYKEHYTHYVIIPPCTNSEVSSYQVINKSNIKNVVLLDKVIAGIERPFSAVYVNFEKDIYKALKQVLLKLGKYKTIKIIFPLQTYFPEVLLKGFVHFCDEHNFSHRIIQDIEGETITEGDVYICLLEDDLAKLLERFNETGFEIGKQVGIISYNESPLKRFINNGISTISSNFGQMGEIAARTILDGKLQHVEIPFLLNLRSSL